MRKKLVILLLTVVCGVCLALGISACNLHGSDGSDTNSSDSSTDYGSSGSTDSGNDGSGGSTSSGDDNSGGDADSGDDGSDDGGSDSDSTEHEHNLQAIEAVAVTCTTDGNIAYWYCGDCGKFYSDAEATVEITLADTVIEATGHTYSGYSYDEDSHWQICMVCDEEMLAENHIYDDYNICTVCGYEQNKESEGLVFTLSDDGSYYTVSGIGDCTDTEIVIPSTYNDLSVKSIAEGAFEGQTQITSVYVPDSVVYIGSGAFSGCSSLVSITLPFVGSSASATSASSSTLFGYIFGTSSYTGGTSTKQYYAGSGYSYVTYYIPTTLTTVTITGGDIFYGAFYNCDSLTSIEIPNSVTSIGNYSFYNCSSLTSITIPNSVTSIGGSAFNGCTSLTEINFNATAMEDLSSSNQVFYKAGQSGDGITVNIGANVTSIPAFLFSSAPNITSVVFEDNSVCTSIGSYAFRNCTKLTSITIPDSVTTIGAYVFYGCDSLTNVTIPDSVTTIGAYVFYGCTSLTNVTIPESVTSIGSYAFWGCTSLTSIIISDSVTSIGTYAFYGCSSLESITIGEGVTSIGNYAFYNCTALTEINFNATAMSDLSSSNYVFYCAGQSGSGITVTIGADVTKIPAYLFYPYSSSSYAPKITSVVFEENSKCTSIGNYAFYNCSSLVSITIPDSVTSIGASSFRNCSSLKSITISEGVTSIGSSAFQSCTSLISVTIGSSVNSIGDSAFGGCYRLVEIYNLSPIGITAGSTDSGYVGYYALNMYNAISGGSHLFDYFDYTFVYDSDNNYYLISYNGTQTNITLPDLQINGISVNYEINQYAFYGCTSLESITIPDSVTSIGGYAFSGCTLLESIIIGDGVTSIGYCAFFYCSSLTSITIPDSVTSIGGSAFMGCSSLVSITLPFVGSSAENAYYTNFGYIFGAYSYSSNSSYVPASLKTVIIGGTSIADSAFRNCTTIENITISDSVTSIGKYAFYDCTALTEINFNAIAMEDLSLSNYVFTNAGQNGGGITVNIGANVTKLPAYLFYNCTALTEINFNATAMVDLSSYNYVFYCAGQSGDGITVTIGANVTKIPAYLFYQGGSSSYAPYITSVVFDDGSVCASIGSSAFQSCTSLTSIIIPDSVTSIGGSAFSGCYRLVEIYNLSSLEIIAGSTGNGGIGYYALNVYTASSGKSHLFDYSGYTFIYDSDNNYYLVSYNGTETDLTLPDLKINGSSVNYEINQHAFYECTSLTSIIISDSVTSIGAYAFYKCTSLTSVTIPDSVTSIGGDAFSNCTSLTSIYYSGTASQWASISFGNYNANPLRYAGNLYLNGTLATDITIEGITVINAYAFYGCTLLESIIIGDGVTSIGSSAFYNCASLTSVTIGDGVTSIGSSAFYNTAYYNDNSNWDDNVLYINTYLIKADTSISGSYTIKDGTNVIANSAFNNCTMLENITIPDSVISIGKSAFSGCYRLVEIYNLSSLEIIAGSEDNGRVGYYALNVYTASSGESHLFVYSGYTFIYDSDNNYYLVSYNGTETDLTLPDLKINGSSVNYEINQYAFYECTSLTSIIISDSVTSIGNYAFYGCSSLTSIEIPNSVTSIDSWAFYKCTSLKSVYYSGTASQWASISFVYAYTNPLYYAGNLYLNGTLATDITIEGITSINACAFYKCTSLTSITIGSSVTSIGDSAFYECTSLASIIISDSVTSIGYSAFSGCTSLTSVTIGSGVTTIGGDAFAYCTSLTSITIPDSVSTIGTYAFYKCTSLTNVTFKNTSGWYVTKTSGATSGTLVTVTDASTNATYLTSTYCNYCWYRSES